MGGHQFGSVYCLSSNGTQYDASANTKLNSVTKANSLDI